MTRAEIKRRVRMYTPESPGSSGWDDPFALDQLVKDVANEVARKTDCYEDVRYLDIEEDVQVYCAPDIYRPVAVFAKDSSDVWNRLFVLRSHDDNFDSVRFDTAADPVTHVGFRGGNQLVLAPTPSTTRAAGVMIEGYCQPGEYWVYDEDGVAQTPAETDECPLPVWAHDAVVYGCMARRAEIARDFNAAAMFRSEYRSLLGDVAANAGLYRARTAKALNSGRFV